MNWMEPEQFEMRQAPIKPRKISVDMAVRDAQALIRQGVVQVSDLDLPAAIEVAFEMCGSLDAMEQITRAAAQRASVLRTAREHLEQEKDTNSRP
ncbi:MAG: hypothetical protein AAGK66_07345 [Pseudomonadota bacterium]